MTNLTHFTMRHSTKMLKSIDAILPESDGALTVRRVILSTLNLLNETDEKTKNSLIHLLGDERIGIGNGLLSRLLSDEQRRDALGKSIIVLSRANRLTAIAVTQELDKLLVNAKGLITYLQPRVRWQDEQDAQSNVWHYGFGILGRLTEEPDLYLYPQSNVIRQWLTAPREQVQELKSLKEVIDDPRN